MLSDSLQVLVIPSFSVFAASGASGGRLIIDLTCAETETAASSTDILHIACTWPSTKQQMQRFVVTPQTCVNVLCVVKHGFGNIRAHGENLKEKTPATPA